MLNFKRPFSIALSATLLCTAALTHAQGFSFGLWGDMPYEKAGDKSKMAPLIHSINHSNIVFSIYDGDIKDGSSRCDDKVFTDALSMFSELKKPVVYVPGDNEWTDCHRLNNGGFDTNERLSHLRKVMFPSEASLGQTTMPLTHQGTKGGAYYENTRFSHGKITFITLNVPGSNNNKVLDHQECTHKSARTLAQCADNNAEYLARDRANIAWLAESFAHAKQHQSLGVVVTIQGDPGFDLPETEDVDESKLPQHSGYEAFKSSLAQETAAFTGQVLFVHGDTHFFKMDKPLYSPSKMLANFTRLQTFGSPHLHWVKVVVDDASPNIFTIQPVLVKQ